MQLVINIDDNFYKRAMVYKGEQFPDNDDLLSALITAVNNGVSLPKGHGDLIDRNDLKYEKYNSYAYAIANAPIIIEADEVEE